MNEQDNKDSEKLYRIPVSMLVINQSVDTDIDPIFLNCFVQAFDWANRMGMEGKRVTGLTILEPEDDPDPLNLSPAKLICFQKCTKEEKEAWEKNQENQIYKAIKDQLEDG